MNSDKTHIVVGSAYQVKNKDPPITGSKGISGNGFNGSFPLPPPPHLLDVNSPDSNYDYSPVGSNLECTAEMPKLRIVQAITQSPKNVRRSSNKNRIPTNKKTSQQHNSQKDSRRENSKMIERKNSKNEGTEDKDWMPMRQLFNAHKL